MVLAGLILAAVAWQLPVNLKSVSPALLRAAGEGTPSLSNFGIQLVEGEKIGPASLVLTAARAVGDPGAPALQRSLQELTARQPALAAWGGWDPFLDPLFDLRAASGRKASTPVFDFFLPDSARTALRDYLANSGSIGVQELLGLRGLKNTGRFVPATAPGGQPLDALILLTAMLYQGERLSPPLQRELRGLAENAAAEKDLGDLEPFFFDLLSLARRLDWGQLSELLNRTEDTRTVGEYAHLARVAPDQFPLLYAAALCGSSADQAATYLLKFGKSGAADLRTALSNGTGAVQQLVLRQVPVNRESGSSLSAAGAAVLAHPQLMLAAKYTGYLFGMFCILYGLDRWIVTPDRRGSAPPFKAGVLALLLAALLVVATEPFLLRAAPVSEYRLQLHLPVLLAAPPAPPAQLKSNHPSMETSTVISIGIFALLQVVMYFICLRKISEIEQQDVSPQLKYRLMENEENLFDSGLYVGMMGTAAALVLQVLGVLEPNLLAAYSSNLFGIICVALVKIRHVRGYRRRLILEMQTTAPAPAPQPAPIGS
jgi:hypothetical protein